MAAFAETADELVSDGVQRFEALELPSDEADRYPAQVYIDELERRSTAIDELRTVIEHQRHAIRPAAERMEARAREAEERNETGPGLRPATEREEQANIAQLRDTQLTQAALDRIRAKLDHVLQVDGGAATGAQAYGMHACGGEALFISV